MHDVVVRLAASLPEARTVVLAGGGAMLAHELVERITRDVDLFTDRDAEEAVAVATALRSALRSRGWDVEAAVRLPHENRFVAVEPESGRRVQIEVFADGGRLRPPVRLAVGPVLHRDDLAADKVLAMWDRGEPRDYIDVTALLGVYGARELFALAAAKDAGLTADLLVDSLRRVHRFQTQDWTDAGFDAALARRAATAIDRWRRELTRHA